MLKKIIIGLCCIIVEFTFSGCGEKIEEFNQTLEGDYIINIYVNEHTFNEGEDIEVVTFFENNSGQEQQINSFIDIYAFDVDRKKDDLWDSRVREDYTTIAKGETIYKHLFGKYLEKGTYHLVAYTVLDLEIDYIQVLSNSINITVK